MPARLAQSANVTSSQARAPGAPSSRETARATQAITGAPPRSTSRSMTNRQPRAHSASLHFDACILHASAQRASGPAVGGDEARQAKSARATRTSAKCFIDAQNVGACREYDKHTASLATRLVRRASLGEEHGQQRRIVRRRARVLEADLPRADLVGEASFEGEHSVLLPRLKRRRDLRR